MSKQEGKTLSGIDLEEDMILLCVGLYRDSPYFVKGNEYKVVSQKGGLGVIIEDGTFQSSSGSWFIIKEKSISLRNVKIDLRKPDGTVDQEKGKAFQEAVFATGGSWCISETESYREQPFLYVREHGILSSNTLAYENFFFDAPHQEITFDFSYKLDYKASLRNNVTSDKECKLNKIVSDLEEQLEKAKAALLEV